MTALQALTEMKKKGGYRVFKKFYFDEVEGVNVSDKARTCHVYAKHFYKDGVFNTVARVYDVTFSDGKSSKMVCVPNVSQPEDDPYIGFMESVVILY